MDKNPPNEDNSDIISEDDIMKLAFEKSYKSFKLIKLIFGYNRQIKIKKSQKIK